MKKLFVVFLGVLLLLPFSASAADLKYGMKNNEEVRQVQQYLKDGRYYKGDVTGNFYSVTLAAVKKFQKANGLKVTGVWNQSSVDKMIDLAVNTEVSPTSMADNNWTPTPAGYVMGNNGNFVPSSVINYPQAVAVANSVVQTQIVPIIPTPYIPTITQTNNPPSNLVADTNPPKIIFNGWSNVQTTYDIERKSLGSPAVSWYIGGRTGNQDDLCENCLVVKTDKPTTLKVEYLEGIDSNTFDPSTNTNTVKMFEDTTLTNTHIIMLKNYLKPFRNIYTFGYTVTDSFGNETKNPISLPWNSGRIMSYDPNINESYTEINNVKTNY